MTSQTYDTLDDIHQTSATTTLRPAYWSAVFAMTLCVFALITSEFLPVSLLTPIATELGISEGLAGYGIAISGAFAVIASLSISSLAGSIDRKTLLLFLTLLMCISGLIVALAPNYLVYMIGRALIGIVIGGFWSMSAAIAMRLVPAQSVAKALAIFNGGNALAIVIAPPLGSFLGEIIGWRGVFFALVPVTILALIWQWISLPSLKVEPQQKQSGNIFRLLKNPLVRFGMLGVGTFFIGQFILFTYIRPFLENVTQVNIPILSTILLIIGVAGLIGTMIVGTLLKTGIYRVLVIIPALMALIALALIAFGTNIAAVMTLLGFWGLLATAAPVGWWVWLANSLPKDAEAGGGLMVAAIQLSVALGSMIGGMLFDGSGYKITFITSAVILLIAASLAFLTYRTQRS